MKRKSLISNCAVSKDGYVSSCFSLMAYHDEKNICLQSFVKDGEILNNFYTLNTDKKEEGLL